ncbi:deoxynucleoside kinase [Staphylococcus pragensis]|uniref:Deoxynucleoside kinase n=1 Tax=Staphylococcus pragensis TaxID=1611836 RepID=A0A4Z1BA53_9STAP|nr:MULTISPECIES: deoxynucleoside kinase [Staphylococcus]RTX88804.1 deoxynucleoside kinase [Staphylococcus carnosus]TGN24447.1 deoxynucleoside kinase [Staphylococcus pragensis]GGG97950.1 deoxyguanosine kinase [Staphylococcus pragensis]
MNKPFIAIEGPIGVGKSSLAHKLSQTLNYYEEKEIIDENPFLSDFYDDISKWSFQTEMFFLCNRYKQAKDIAEMTQGVVSDYHIYKNKLFARNTLDDAEFDKFNRIFDILTEDIEMPNMIIFLDADLNILKKRIAKRNRSFEHQIEDNYLLNLKRDYLALYEALKQEGANVVLINTSDIDFVNNEADYQNILEQIKPMIGDSEHE